MKQIHLKFSSLKQQTYYLTVSMAQELGGTELGSSASGSLMRLQTECWLGWHHLKSGWGWRICFQGAHSWLWAGGLSLCCVHLSLGLLGCPNDTAAGSPGASERREAGFYVLVPDVTHGLFHHIQSTKNKSLGPGHTQGEGDEASHFKGRSINEFVDIF